MEAASFEILGFGDQTLAASAPELPSPNWDRAKRARVVTALGYLEIREATGNEAPARAMVEDHVRCTRSWRLSTAKRYQIADLSQFIEPNESIDLRNLLGEFLRIPVDHATSHEQLLDLPGPSWRWRSQGLSRRIPLSPRR